MKISFALNILIVALTLGCFSGCAGGTKSGWQAWKTDVADTAKALTGTGEYLGASTQSRDIERSLSQHRQ